MDYQKKDIVVVLCTTPQGRSDELANKLVGNKLAACVNVIHNISSTYYWQGKIEKDSEDLMIIKTRRSFFEKLNKFIKENHPYTVPEIVALNVEDVSESYLQWLIDYLKS
jgi:periplasmic divalent cation tolerance protein